MRKAVLLDRDGVINRDYGYVGSIARFELLEGVAQALHDLKQLGYATVVVTNQSGIARGMYTEADYQAVTSHMQQLLAPYAATFDGIYFCPHHPQAQVAAYRQDCACRKPQPGMLLKAQAELDLDLAHSIMVGDHLSDLRAGVSAGVGNLVLVGTHRAEAQAQTELTFTYYPDLPHFVQALQNGSYTPS